MGPPNDIQVCLQRDALSTPWGFRLQGGKDFKTPLTVQRVFVGSPADGELHRGDAILGINGYDAANMIHKQAQDLIKNAGGTINLIVRKASGGGPPRVVSSQSRQGFQAALPADQGSYRSRGLDTFTPKPAPPIGSVVTNAHAPRHSHLPHAQTGFVPNQFGTDYSQPGPARSYSAPPNRPRGPPAPGSMLNRVQNSLTSSVYGGPGYDQNGGGGGEDEYYQQIPVNQLKQAFNQADYAQQQAPRQRPRPASHSPGRPAWSKPTDGIDSGLADPGWSPVKAPNSAPHYPNANRYAPANRPPPINRPDPASAYQPQPPQPQSMNRLPPQQQHQPQQQNFTPAWAGSLKSSGGPKQWEMREGAAIATGGPAPPHMQEHPAPAPHQPRVQNVHYGPGGEAPQYQQQGDGGASDSAHVAHLQYNTPIGLYSKGNVQEVLTGQTAGRPGDGTMQVTGGGPPGQKAWDPNRSEVLRLLQEEERPHGGHPRGYGLHAGPNGPQQQASPRGQQPQQQQASPRGHPQPHQQEEPQYGGYQDPNKQSPMMHALENQMANVQVGDGTSDF